jgi:hypothetical protein
MERYIDQPAPAGGGSRLAAAYNQRLQVLLDKAAPWVTVRWLVWLALTLLFALRVWWLKGFYIVAYALGIFNLNLLLGFLSPQVDPALEGPTLPSKGNDEFKPFVRRLPEFKFWYSSAKAILLGFAATYFAAFDVPVFWPILLLYWLVLFFLTMKRQIRHMIKHRYVPFSVGKRTYAKESSTSK